jgi:hypothetical protein
MVSKYKFGHVTLPLRCLETMKASWGEIKYVKEHIKEDASIAVKEAPHAL